MSGAPFVHLRTHSAYSLSEGALTIKDLVKLCQENEMPAVAITDTGNLFGALEFAMAAAAGGVQPIIGLQLAIAREAGGASRSAVEAADELLLLAQDEAGYQNLLQLASKPYLEGPNDGATILALDELIGLSDGLLALTGGARGGVARLLGEGQRAAALHLLDRLKVLFPNRLYVEIQRHGAEIEDQTEPGLIDLAYESSLPIVATNEVFFADRGMYRAHDALLCIAEGSYVSQSDRRRVTEEHYFKSPAEMVELFRDLPEAIENTVTIARRCAFMPTPRKPILPVFETPSGRSENEELRTQAEAGLEARLQKLSDGAASPEEYRARLKYELQVIEDMGFSGYFLIVADFIKWAKDRGIPVGPGRGSGAGSVVAWALTITDLDPLRWGLVFERFLNPERVSMPDFDIDFCQDRRDEVIEYVQKRYGSENVAQIITFGKLQARAVLRDVGRVLEMPYGRVDRICKLVPNNPANPVTLAQAIDSEPQLQELRDGDEAVAQLIDTSLKLEGLYRNSSTHAAGVVIGDRPLVQLVPLYRDPRSDMLATQFNMKYVELAGLVKFDFLGLKTLTVLARAVEQLRKRGVDLDLSDLPLNDPAAFELMSRGETLGVFQFESSGMRSLLREAKVGNFEDIVALIALYRPGPMENIPKYVACKQGRERPEFLHETIEPIVADTYGVIIYQEQVLQIAQAFAGFTLGKADLLRRAMGKKIKSEMEAQRAAFVAGAVDRGVSRDRAEYVFDLVDKFAGYGFNKAHSAGYGLLAYQTAFLKAHHPVEFLAATMTYDAGNTDRLSIFKRELERLDIPLLPPDVNRSEADFVVEESGGKPAVRYALGAIKGVGRAAMEAVATERRENGPFRDLFNLGGRLDPQILTRKQLESLTEAGALDGLNRNRAQVLAAIDMLLAHGRATNEDRRSGQVSLFGDVPEISAPTPQLPTVPDWPQATRLERERHAIGFYLSAHPLDEYEKVLTRLSVLPSASLKATVLEKGGQAEVTLAGTVLGIQRRTSQRGSAYAFIQLSDSSGAYEATIFAEPLAEAAELLERQEPVLISANARIEDDDVRIVVRQIRPLDQAVAAAPLSLRVWLREIGPLDSLRQIIEMEAGPGRSGGDMGGHVSLVIDTEDREVEIALEGAYSCSPQVRAAIKSIPGIIEVQEL